MRLALLITVDSVTNLGGNVIEIQKAIWTVLFVNFEICQNKTGKPANTRSYPTADGQGSSVYG